MGILDEAEAAYRRAIAIEPDHAPAHANLGDVLLEQGDPQAAVDVCDAYLKVHPYNSCVLAFKTIALDELGQRDAVRFLVDFDRFIRPVRFYGPGWIHQPGRLQRGAGAPRLHPPNPGFRTRESRNPFGKALRRAPG